MPRCNGGLTPLGSARRVNGSPARSRHQGALSPRGPPSGAPASLPRSVTYEIAPPRPAGRSLPPWPTTRPLRAWQQAAAAAVFDHAGEAFLASATPAAGKTTFGLHVAHRMLAEGRVARVAVVAPTTHICRQWAADAARYGISLEPNRPNAAGPEPRDRHGVAVTYATVAAGAAVHRRRCAERPTLLIADEPHHMGEDATWGRSTVEAFARRPLPAAAVGHAVPLRQRRRSRGSPTTRTASRARTMATATRRRSWTACAGRSRSTRTAATWSG